MSVGLSPEAALQWMRLVLASADLLRLLKRQGISRQKMHDAEQPLTVLNQFWRQQLPLVPDKTKDLLLAWMAIKGHWVISIACQAYPSQLKELADAPWLLFGSGNPAWLQTPQLAVVGSRRASPLALAITEQLSSECARAGWTITSGMALGIDGCAHQAALDMQAGTVAVLGCGIDICYPPRHARLRRQIEEQGCVISEIAPGNPVLKRHFPRRNRLISGLSQGVLVTAATLNSGSMITARLAAEQGREVFAVPGSARDDSLQGCNQLIQQGAKLVMDSADVLMDLPVLSQRQREAVAPASCLTASPVGQGQKKTATSDLANAEILVNVGFETTAIDSLVAQSGLSVAEVINQLVELELAGWVAAVPGGYVRVRR